MTSLSLLPNNELVIAWLTLLLAGTVKGVIGMGLPTVALGLLSLSMKPSAAAALLVIPSLATNILQFASGPGILSLFYRYRYVAIAIFIGGWLGQFLPVSINSWYAGMTLGVILVAYAAVGLANLQLQTPQRHQSVASPLAGFCTGLITAVTGVAVLPIAPYLQSIGLSKDELVRALGLSFTIATIALACNLSGTGQLRSEIAFNSALLLIPAVLGMYLGQRLSKKISPNAFRIWFFIGLFALGVNAMLAPALEWLGSR